MVHDNLLTFLMRTPSAFSAKVAPAKFKTLLRHDKPKFPPRQQTPKTDREINKRGQVLSTGSVQPTLAPPGIYLIFPDDLFWSVWFWQFNSGGVHLTERTKRVVVVGVVGVDRVALFQILDCAHARRSRAFWAFRARGGKLHHRVHLPITHALITRSHYSFLRKMNYPTHWGNG